MTTDHFSCQSLTLALTNVRAQLLRGRYVTAVVQELGPAPCDQFLKKQLWDANREGRAVLPALEHIRATSIEQECFGLKLARLWQTLLVRQFVGLVLAMAARGYVVSLLPKAQDGHLLRADIVALGAGAFLAMLCLVTTYRALGRIGWLWQGGLTAKGEAWIARMLGSSRARLPDIAADAKEQQIAQERRLTACEDALPIVEILGVGIPSALMLAVPIIAILS
jgi:hypothetical protein